MFKINLFNLQKCIDSFCHVGTSNFWKESLLGRTNKGCFIKRHKQIIMRVMTINVKLILFPCIYKFSITLELSRISDPLRPVQA